MARLLAALFLLALLPAPLARAGELKEGVHTSRALGKEQPYSIYIPEARHEGERFPVLYVLHGKWGDYTDWTERGNAQEAAENYRMILVFPDGGQFSWYLDSPVMSDSQYETYLTEELIPYIDATYPTIPRQEARGIMGLSMGGHGALLMAAHHPNLFASASSLSGILKLTTHHERDKVTERLGPWPQNRARWEANSVWDQAAQFQTGRTRLLFDCGRDDTKTGAIWDGRMLHERLVKLGVPHIWRIHPGTHSWEYWQGHLPDHLNFHQASMLDAMEEPERWFRHYFQRMDIFLEENAHIPFNQPTTPTVCLAGSSTFEGFPRDLLPDYRVYNRGIASDHLGIYERGLSKRLEASVFDMDPDCVIINMGANDIGDRHRNDTGEPTEERMAEEFQRIINTIRERQPGARLYITNCSPTGGRFAHLNESIVSWNQWLEEFAEGKELKLIDIHTPVVAENGQLTPSLTRDGLHLNREGYEIWARLIRQALASSEDGFERFTE